MTNFYGYLKKHIVKTVILSLTFPIISFVVFFLMSVPGLPCPLTNAGDFLVELLFHTLGVLFVCLGLLFLVLAPTGMLVLFVSLILRKHKTHWLTLLGIILLINSIGTYIGLFCGCNIFYLMGLRRLARKAQVVIVALDKYYAEHKEYPETLDSLTPKYISRIPKTGVCDASEYIYHRSVKYDKGKCSDPSDIYDSVYMVSEYNSACTGGYELKIGSLWWDGVRMSKYKRGFMVYWPREKYHRIYRYEGEIGGWAMINPYM